MFLAAIAVLYASAIVSTTLTLNAYFAQTWDVATFLQAAHRFLDGGTPFDLYAQSRVAQTWPYAYPPLHALMVAAALLLRNLLPVVPEYVWARLPAMLADIAIAFVLYRIVERRSEDHTLARVAALVWLFNPVTFYDTAVQGHFESEWLLFVLLAYAWHEEGRGIGLPTVALATAGIPTVALAIAVLFKQVAILFAIPFWVTLVTVAKTSEVAPASGDVASEAGATSEVWRHVRRLAFSLLLFALVVGAVCLPFLLYSNDFLHMNLTYVENVPVQTQSWLVGVLGLTRAAPEALTSDFLLLRYQTIVTMLAAFAIALLAARRGWSLYVAATLIALAFFLTSKKVMGYYYVMLLPFMLIAELSKRRFLLISAAVVATAWIALSPYYAAWTNHAHWWLYALLGALNSLLFAWMLVQVVREKAEGPDENPHRVVTISVGLFAGAVLAALLQPLVSSALSPIRPPIVPPGTEGNAAAALFMLLLLLIVGLFLSRRWTRPIALSWGIPLIFAPLFFAVYTLTKESTAIFEMALKALGG